MAEQNLILTAKDEARKLATAENKLWEVVEKYNFAELSPTQITVKDESGLPVKDAKGNAKTAPEGEAFILQIDALIAKKTIADAKGFLKSDEMQDFFKRYPDSKTGYEQYVGQYEAIAQQTDTLNKSLERAGLKPEEAEKTSGKVIELVDARYEEGGPGGKNFNAEAIATEALKTGPFPEREAIIGAREMLRAAAQKDRMEGISVEDIKTLTPQQQKALDVDGNGLTKDDLGKIYAGFSNPKERASAVESLANVLKGAGVQVADYQAPSLADAPQGKPQVNRGHEGR